MSTYNVFTREPLTVGLVVRETFRIFFSQFARIMVIAVVGYFPLLALMPISGLVSSVQPGAAGPSVMVLGLIAGAAILFIVLTPVSTAGIAYGVFQLARGKSIQIDECLRIGFQRLPRIILLSIALAVLTFLGFLACIVPGILVSIANAVAIPAAVVEGLSTEAAMKRSHQLTKGSRGVVAGAFSALTVIQYAVALVLGLLAVFAPWVSFISFVTSIAGGALFSTVYAVLYYGLRSSKESIGVDEIAAVFE